MATINIEDLDDLPGNFNASTDYIIVQRIGSGTYKLALSDLSDSSAQSTRYVDQASLMVPSSNASTLTSGKRISFQKSGLFNTNSSFVIQMNFDNGSTVFTKDVGADTLNNLAGLIPSNRAYQPMFKTIAGIVYADIIIDQSTDTITFDNIFVKANSSFTYQNATSANVLNSSSMRTADSQLSAFISASIFA
tara:strand:- start:618 stop:1193 length:576 start_codon:yes stop_codon:yes gene_type:complete